MNHKLRLLAFIMSAVMLISSMSLTVFAFEYDSADVSADAAAAETGDPAVVITGADNTATGTKISWNAADGAAAYGIYLRDGSRYNLLARTAQLSYTHAPLENGWNRIGETTDTSIVHDNLTGGTTYKYTVRGVDGNGDFITDFNTDGWDNMFIEPPVITSLDNTDEGIVINWKPCDVDAQLPGYGYEDYAPYMMSTHIWPLDKYWYSELTLKNGKAVWTPIQYF